MVTLAPSLTKSAPPAPNPPPPPAAPDPPVPPVALPLARVNSLMETVPLSTKKIRLALFPLTVMVPAPSPVMLRSPLITGKAEPRVIVPANPPAKVIVSAPPAAFASIMA